MVDLGVGVETKESDRDRARLKHQIWPVALVMKGAEISTKREGKVDGRLIPLGVREGAPSVQRSLIGGAKYPGYHDCLPLKSKGWLEKGVCPGLITV